MDRPDWDEYFIGIAKAVAARSTCPRAAVGAVLVKNNRVIATGYNGAPSGCPHCEDVDCKVEINYDLIDGELMEKSRHCQNAIHAETNAIAQAAMMGISCQFATLYYWDSKGRESNNVMDLVEHCPKCGNLALAAQIGRVYGRGGW